MLHHTSNSAKLFFVLAHCNTLYNSINQVSVGDGFFAATEELLMAYHVTVELEWASSFSISSWWQLTKISSFLHQFLCFKFGNRDHWNTHVRSVRRVVRLDPVFLNQSCWGASWRSDVIERKHQFLLVLVPGVPLDSLYKFSPFSLHQIWASSGVKFMSPATITWCFLPHYTVD